MEEKRRVRARLHPLEVVTPLALLCILAVFAMPNYYEYRPRAEMRETVAELERLITTARKASLDEHYAWLRFEPGSRSAALWVGPPQGVGAEPHAEFHLPSSVDFGYDEDVAPFPSLVLEDGTNLAATSDGITFEDDTLLFRDGLLEGFPGLVYLRNGRGDQMALYVRISGEVLIHHWSGGRWTRNSEFAARM